MCQRRTAQGPRRHEWSDRRSGAHPAAGARQPQGRNQTDPQFRAAAGLRSQRPAAGSNDQPNQNALKRWPRRTGAASEDQNGNRSRRGGIAAEDTGPGVSPEKAEGIFDAFVSTKPNGMGLGLAICRMILEPTGSTHLLRRQPALGDLGRVTADPLARPAASRSKSDQTCFVRNGGLAPSRSLLALIPRDDKLASCRIS